MRNLSEIIARSRDFHKLFFALYGQYQYFCTIQAVRSLFPCNKQETLIDRQTSTLPTIPLQRLGLFCPGNSTALEKDKSKIFNSPQLHTFFGFCNIIIAILSFYHKCETKYGNEFSNRQIYYDILM